MRRRRSRSMNVREPKMSCRERSLISACFADDEKQFHNNPPLLHNFSIAVKWTSFLHPRFPAVRSCSYLQNHHEFHVVPSCLLSQARSFSSLEASLTRCRNQVPMQAAQNASRCGERRVDSHCVLAQRWQMLSSSRAGTVCGKDPPSIFQKVQVQKFSTSVESIRLSPHHSAETLLGILLSSS
jgi:hypothetical protein